METEAQIGRLGEAIRPFLEQNFERIPPAEAAEELVEVRHAIDLLELAFSQLAARFAETEEYAAQGSSTAIDWIRHNCKMSGHAAADRVCVGQLIEGLPGSYASMCESEIGFGHVSLIARTAQYLPDSPTGSSFAEDKLLAHAREFSVGRFRHVCEHARHAADAAGVADEQAVASESRRLALSTSEDGTVFLRGHLDSIGGAAVRTALEPLAQKAGEDDDRRHDKRLADALVELAEHALDTARVPQTASQRTHLQLTASLETLIGQPGASAGELEFSSPVATPTVQRLGCDSTVTRLLLGSDSSIIDVGRAKRVVPGATRRALNLRDRCCRWPGCDRPSSWTAAHHLVHWAHGGRTDLENLVLLCHRHHWMVHEGGWKLVRGADGELMTIRPPVRFDSLARGPGRPVAA